LTDNLIGIVIGAQVFGGRAQVYVCIAGFERTPFILPQVSFTLVIAGMVAVPVCVEMASQPLVAQPPTRSGSLLLMKRSKVSF
jgi:hypothetical protein